MNDEMMTVVLALYSYRNSVCPSVRLSRSGIVSKQLNISPYFLQHYGSFPGTKQLCETPTGSVPMGTLNTGGVYKYRDFRPIYGYMWETI